MKQEFKLLLGDKEIIVETGSLAQLADGCVTVRSGDTVIMATAVISKYPPRDGVDFLPLSVSFQERMFASGKIKSSRFQKRPGRPADDKILISRVIDRTLRPLFPKHIHSDIQVIIMPLSFDNENEFDMISALASSCAIEISQIPFNGPVATVRVGMINNELVLNPSVEARTRSDLDLIVSTTLENVVMIEAGANEISEEKMLEAIEFGKKWGQKICQFFAEIRKEVGVPKMEIPAPEVDEELKKFISDNFADKIEKCIFEIPGKMERGNQKKLLATEAKELVIEKFGEERDLSQFGEMFDKVFKGIIRESILKKEKRIAGRKLTEVRPITTEVSYLPRTHGSAIFQRGETQGLSVVTLGGPGNNLITEGIEGENKHTFFHHYSFLPFSVGECDNRLFTGNREIGHGALAERAIKPVLPKKEDFAYVIHASTEILASNGSSSMAATCGTTLALMDAGVPITAPVSGIAMGLMTDDQGNFKILSDIQDEEDSGGDMDFKVAGTEKGITAIQMDIKCDGLSKEIFDAALKQSKEGRAAILKEMLKSIDKPRESLSEYAPRLITIKINPEKIRDVIGKGGEMINKIIDETHTEIDIDQDGTVVITAVNGEDGKRAEEWIRNLTAEAEVGKIYDAKVVRIESYGAFADLIPTGQSGLIHISLIANERVEDVHKYLKIGQIVKIKLLSIDEQGRLRISMKDAPQN